MKIRLANKRNRRLGPELLPRRSANTGFTMIEIALCLAIIGFALVAIIGILPAGMQVQKDNREDTVVNQDAAYWMEAIRNGAQGLDEMTNYVDAIITNTVPVPGPYTSGFQIIGLLSTPGTNIADVRAVSGPAAEKSRNSDIQDFAFKYRMRVVVQGFSTPSVQDSPGLPGILENLHELRLTFNWPVIGDRSDPTKVRVGNNRQTVRTLVSGEMIGATNNGLAYLFFRP